ncbi:MAG TPA: hypothetical protein VHB97_01885, partial [Polyangia bacterium]|nr:hypothetical protein [Polyangia bacterium]
APKATGAIGRFWDVFIGPNDIRFEVRGDYTLGSSVFRDIVIHTKIAGAFQLDVPAYLLYQLDDTTGTLQIARLSAHWDLARMSLGAMKLGPKAWIAMTAMFGRMLKLMGVPWVAGYLSSLWKGIGGRGLASVKQLATAVEARDSHGLEALLEPSAVVELGIVEAPARDLFSVIPAGARLRVEAPVAAGWTTSFRYTIDGASPKSGLARLEFAPDTRRIRSIRFFS